MIKIMNVPPVKCDYDEETIKKQIEEREKVNTRLRELGIHTALYTGGDPYDPYDVSWLYPEHPDGIHNYAKDASEARKILEAGGEVTGELEERLLYYKKIVDAEFKKREG